MSAFTLLPAIVALRVGCGRIDGAYKWLYRAAPRWGSMLHPNSYLTGLQRSAFCPSTPPRPQHVQPPAPPHLPPNAPPLPSRGDGGTMAAPDGGRLREPRARGAPYTLSNFSAQIPPTAILRPSPIS